MQKFSGKYLVYLIKQQFRQHDFVGELGWGRLDAGIEREPSLMNNLKRFSMWEGW